MKLLKLLVAVLIFFVIWGAIAMFFALPTGWYAEGMQYWSRVETAFWNVPLGALITAIFLCLFFGVGNLPDF